MPRYTITPFDAAADVGNIRYRLAPIDVGFDLRVHPRLTVNVLPVDDPIRVSYAGRDGERYVIEGRQAYVLRYLRSLGYRFRTWRTS